MGNLRNKNEKLQQIGAQEVIKIFFFTFGKKAREKLMPDFATSEEMEAFLNQYSDSSYLVLDETYSQILEMISSKKTNEQKFKELVVAFVCDIPNAILPNNLFRYINYLRIGRIAISLDINQYIIFSDILIHAKTEYLNFISVLNLLSSKEWKNPFDFCQTMDTIFKIVSINTPDKNSEFFISILLSILVPKVKKYLVASEDEKLLAILINTYHAANIKYENLPFFIRDMMLATIANIPTPAYPFSYIYTAIYNYSVFTPIYEQMISKICRSKDHPLLSVLIQMIKEADLKKIPESTLYLLTSNNDICIILFERVCVIDKKGRISFNSSMISNYTFVKILNKLLSLRDEATKYEFFKLHRKKFIAYLRTNV